MIHYALACADAHGFDGWFASAASFDTQADSHQIACPTCGSTRVTRALMAPSVRRAAPETRRTPPPAAPAAPPAEALSLLQKLRAAVEAHCRDVGSDFADRALRMHRGEIAAEPIYGDTTPDQAEQLDAHGVEVTRIPWVPRAES